MTLATLIPEKKLHLRKTVLGGALNTQRLVQQLPEVTRLSVELYLLLRPAGDLLTCSDPAVTSVEDWKQESVDLLSRFDEFLRSWRDMAAT